jgi:hypothetical protein
VAEFAVLQFALLYGFRVSHVIAMSAEGHVELKLLQYKGTLQDETHNA